MDKEKDISNKKRPLICKPGAFFFVDIFFNCLAFAYGAYRYAFNRDSHAFT
jgi:hypothetical protein